MNEQLWDKKLHISTMGRDDNRADVFRYPYEPTPYEVLIRLCESGYIHKENILVDYGCGKGRVGFFLNHEIGCRVTGVEYDERIYDEAKLNLRSYKNPEDIRFVCMNAENFEVTDENAFYFFNPFSVEILKSVIRRILDSYYLSPREMHLFFYYPNDEYASYLMNADELIFECEITCGDLFKKSDDREKILVFKIDSIA